MKFKYLLRNPTGVVTLILGAGLIVYGMASVAAPKLLVMYKVTQCISTPVSCVKTAFNHSVTEVQEVTPEPVVIEPQSQILRNPLLTPEQCEAIRTKSACDLYFERNAN